jgi:hypothetical protein
MTVLAIIIGICVTACILIPTRIHSERRYRTTIADLEVRVEQLEVAVADARAQLQASPAYPQDANHLHSLRTFHTANGRGVKCVECNYVEELENPWRTS